MPQSLAAVLVHVIFSTKNREPLIRPEIEAELYPYLATACRSADSPALLINGTADHIHLLVKLGRKTAMADLLEESRAARPAGLKRRGIVTRAFIGKPATALFPSANPKRQP